MSKRPPQRFELTEEHVALLRAANVGWHDIEWGSPWIDPKRPFGNGDLYRDMNRILGGSPVDSESLMPESRRARYEKVYKELEVALQIVLRLGTFEPGIYETSSYYGSDWSRVS